MIDFIRYEVNTINEHGSGINKMVHFRRNASCDGSVYTRCLHEEKNKKKKPP
jgi:hypothetical protein